MASSSLSQTTKARSGPLRVALVGGETLLGRELQDVLSSRLPKALVTSYAASAQNMFGEKEGEAVLVEALTVQALGDENAVLIAGSDEGALHAYSLAKDARSKPVVIDCSGHLGSQPHARLVSPLLEEVKNATEAPLWVIPHPAASALALVFARLARRATLLRAVVEIFEPASERGKRGLTELHQQTSNLLAFKPLEKDVFDAQLAYNLLPKYGEDAPVQLLAVEATIERQLATLLAKYGPAGVVLPSVRLIQAPVFHGYSFSLWLEFESVFSATEIAEILASAQIEIRGKDDEPPTNVGAANQSGLIAGEIRADRNNGRAVWMWVAADNLRLTSDSAADLVSALEANRQ